MDSGAAEKFIDQTYANRLGVEFEALSQPIQITAIDGNEELEAFGMVVDDEG